MRKSIVFLPLLYLTSAFSQHFTYNRDSLFKLLEQPHQPVEQIKLWEDIGDTYAYAGRQDSSRFAYQTVLRIATDFHIDYLLASAYINLGSTFDNTGDYKQALELKYKGLSLAEKTKRAGVRQFALKEIAVTFKSLKNYSEALTYMRKSQIFLNQRADKSPNILNRQYAHMAEIFLGLEQTDSALKYVQLANEVIQKDKDPYAFARAL